MVEKFIYSLSMLSDLALLFRLQKSSNYFVKSILMDKTCKFHELNRVGDEESHEYHDWRNIHAFKG